MAHEIPNVPPCPQPVRKCQVCDKGEAPEGQLCPYCGAVVESRLGLGPPLPPEVVAEENERKRKIQTYNERCLHDKARIGSIVGMVIYGLCGIGLSGALLFSLVVHEEVEGLLKPMNELDHEDAVSDAKDEGDVPVSMALRFFLAIPIAAIIGYAMGQAIALLDWRTGMAVLVSAGAFGLANVILLSEEAYRSSYPLLELGMFFALGSLPGAGSGYLLSSHLTLRG